MEVPAREPMELRLLLGSNDIDSLRQTFQIIQTLLFCELIAAHRSYLFVSPPFARSLEEDGGLVFYGQLIIILMLAGDKTEPILLSSLLESDLDRKTISLPLQFNFLPVQLISKQFTKLNNNHQYRIHYLGPRPHDTISIHKKYAFTEKRQAESASLLQGKPVQRYHVDSRRIVQSYFVQQKLRINTFYKSTLFYRAFQGMNPTLNLANEFTFNSVFQSGNLDCAIKVQKNEFDLFLRIDSNTKGHVQWFYFSICNGSKRERVKLNLCNLSKAKSLYEGGMQPYIYSREGSKLGRGWAQGGINLGLAKKELRYEYLQEKLTKYSYYCLEFQYEFQHENDEVFFAYCVPYTFSRLMQEIKALPKQYTQVAVLGKSLSGVEIPVLHITDFEVAKEKKNILITGRMHPGESNSSHMLEGFIHFINGNHKEAQELRRRVNFFIVPMVNPDGVIIGNTRTSAAGKDLNRQFLLANRDQYPQVALIKEFAKKLHSKYGVFMYLDFHGHSRKKNTFFYGPAYNLSEPNYYKSRILPKLIQKIDSNFRFHSCSFTIDQEKKQTARAIMFQHLKINFTFTIETSIGFYYDCENQKTKQFNEEEWRKMGVSISEGLSKFVVGYEEYEELLKERRASRQKKRPPTASKYVFTEGKADVQQEISFFKRMQPLKIIYNDKSLFGQVIDELKTMKTATNYIKEIDDDCESDAHDENEEFDQSKMKEFNNLLADVAQKTKMETKSKDKKVEKVEKIKEVKTDRQKNRSETLNNLENLQEELKFLSELEQMNKPLTMQADRTKKEVVKNVKFNSLAKKEVKNSLEFKRTQIYRTAILTQDPKERKQIPSNLLNSSLQKKLGSDSQLLRERQSQKVSYFGEYHLYVQVGEKEKGEGKINHQRNSLFRKEKSRKNRKSQMDDSRFMSQTFLQRPGNRPVFDASSNMRIKISPPKSNNYEFKFDEIESVLVAKEKFKDYYRSKVNKSTRNSIIGPASFYGIRQNLNLKLNNKKKFFSQERGDFQGRQSIKIIKFT